MNELNSKLGYRAGVISVLVNIVLFVFKLYIAQRENSVAINADAWHTLSDSLTSLVVIAGIWISGRKADREHPFGHGRAELIGAIVISVLLAVVGMEFFRDSIALLLQHKGTQYTAFSLFLLGTTILAKEGLAQYSFQIARKTGSKSIAADGWHHRSDALTTIIIIAGAIAGRSFWWMDGALGLIMAGFLFHTAVSILKESSAVLLGEAPDEKLSRDIRAIIKNSSSHAKDIHHIHLHRYGQHLEVSLHVRFPGEMSLDEVHNEAEEIEKKLNNALNIVSTIHCEPFRFDECRGCDTMAPKLVCDCSLTRHNKK